MAILHDVPGLEVYVEVDGEKVEECWDPSDVNVTPKACRRYIAAVPGKSFKLIAIWRSDFTPERYSQCARLKIDGVARMRAVLGPKELKRGIMYTFDGHRTTLENGDEFFAPYTFQMLQTGNVSRRFVHLHLLTVL